MAEKTVSVRLAARVDSYVAAMKAAQASTTGFSRATQRNLKTVGTQMQNLGRSATMFVSLPIAALGVASTKMAMDYERAFAQMQGLANVPADEIDALKESVLDLAGETAVAPQELAEALFFAASAGLDSAEAMETVEMAARASAAGMGSTTDVVGLVASVLASYGEENISAAEATDILTAAIREGRAEPDELAGALGRVLPIAANMGISFEEVAGATAFMSNTIGDTDETVTALRGTLLAMLDPTAKARQTLLDMGTSTEELHAAIEQDGLLGALELLREHGFDKNAEALSKLFEDNRALVGATILLKDASGDLVPIMDAVANSSGSLGEAFSIAADTDAFKMEQALTQVKVAMIEFGAIILPIAANVAGAIAGMASFFAGLPAPVHATVAAFGGLAAAFGPVVFLAGTFVRNFVAIQGAIALASRPTQLLTRTLGGLAVAAGTAIAVFDILGEGHLNAGAHINVSADALVRATSAAFGESVAAAEAAGEVDALAIAHEALGRAIADTADEELSNALADFNIATGETLDVLKNLYQGSSERIGQILDLIEQRFGVGREAALFFWEQILTGSDDATAAMQIFADETGVSTEVVQDAIDDLGVLTQFATENRQEVAAMADTYLDAQVALGGTAREAVLAAQAIAGNREEGLNAIAVYEEFVRQLVAMEPAQRDAILANDEMTASLVGLSPEAVAAALGLDQTTGSLDDLAESGVSATEAWTELEKVFDARFIRQLGQDLSGIRGPAEGWETVLGLEQLRAWGEALHMVIDPQIAFVESQDSIWEAANAAGDALSEETSSLEDNTTGAMQNRRVVIDWVKDILAGADAQLAMGDSVADVTSTLDHNIGALRQHLIALGLDKDQIDRLLRSLGVYDDDWVAVTKLQGDLLAQKKLELMLLDLDEFDEEFIAEVLAIAETEGAFAAIQHVRQWTAANPANLSVNANVSNAVNAIRSLSGLTVFASVISRFQSAHGRFVPGGTNMLSSLGEEGPEVVLPLDKPGRMSALLGMPQVFGPVASALSKLVPAGTGLGAATSQGGGVHVQNLSVGSRDDIPAAMGMLNELEWRLRVAA